MGGVAIYPALQHRDDFVGKLVVRTGAVRYGRWLETVNFVEGIVERGVCDEVVYVVVFSCGACIFVDEGRRAGKGIVDGSDQL